MIIVFIPNLHSGRTADEGLNRIPIISLLQFGNGCVLHGILYEPLFIYIIFIIMTLLLNISYSFATKGRGTLER